MTQHIQWMTDVHFRCQRWTDSLVRDHPKGNRSSNNHLLQTMKCRTPFLNAKNSKLREPFTQVHNVGLKLGKHGLVWWVLSLLDSKVLLSHQIWVHPRESTQLLRCTREWFTSKLFIYDFFSPFLVSTKIANSFLPGNGNNCVLLLQRAKQLNKKVNF